MLYELWSLALDWMVEMRYCMALALPVVNRRWNTNMVNGHKYHWPWLFLS